MPDKLIAVARTSHKESSLRITLPKEGAEKPNIFGILLRAFHVEQEQ